MLIETGRVVAVEADSLWVETIRQSTCGKCSARSGCGHGLMNRLGDGRRNYIRVLAAGRNLEDCRVNDEVRIGIPEDLLLRGSLIVYAVPLLGLLLGAMLATWMTPSAGDIATLAGAGAGFALAVAGVWSHSRQHQDDTSLQPQLIEVLPASTVAHWAEL